MSERRGQRGDDEVASEISPLGHPHVTCCLVFSQQKNNFTFFYSSISYLSASFGFFTNCAPWVLFSYLLSFCGLLFCLLFLFPWAPRFLPCPAFFASGVKYTTSPPQREAITWNLTPCWPCLCFGRSSLGKERFWV